MHMADALLTPAVAGVMYAASAVVAGASIVELHKEEKQDLISAAKKLPTMAVMSALVFAGQMINYTIPGTGSSGHLCGGLLLTSVLGPWAGFLSMIVILTIQCLFFADGGLLALGANVWNMAFYGCFVGYFLIYRPLMRSRCFARRGERAANRLKITLASVLGCVLTLQLGAFSVVLETTLSGITALPLGAFAVLMQPIHLAIGLVEGLITAAVLPLLSHAEPRQAARRACTWLPQLVPQFQLDFPGIDVQIYQGSYADICAWVKNGTAEIGFLSNSSALDLDFEPLYDDELVCIAPASYRPARPGCVSAEELRGQPFVSQLADVDADIQSYFKTNDLRVDSRCYIVDDQSMIAMVACGRGFAIMPELMFKTGTDPHGCQVLRLEPAAKRSIGLACLSRGGLSPAAKQFVASAREYATTLK